MAEETKLKRLPAVANEFNVGVSTIIDHLKNKGFSVNPATKVTEEMYASLQQAFSKDAALREKAEQINLGKGNREDVVIEKPLHAVGQNRRDDDQEDIIIKGFQSKATPEKPKAPVAEEPKKVVPPAPPAPPVVAQEPEKPKEPVAEEPAKTTAKLDGPKIMGKIDLSQVGKKPADKPVEKEAIKPAAVTDEKPVEKAPVLESKPEAPVAKPAEAAPVAKEDPVVPTEEFFRTTQRITLTGPKILGKIELPTKQERPAASSDNNANSDNKKRKRKRLIKPEQTSGAGGAGGGAAAPAGPRRDGGGGVGRPLPQNRSGAGRPNDRRPGAGGGTGRPSISTAQDGPKEVSEKEIQEKIKSTLAKLGGASGSKGKARAKMKRAKREANEVEDDGSMDNILEVTEFISVSELASLMDVTPTEVISKCMQLGVIVSINQRLDAEVIELVASEFGLEVKFTDLTDGDEDDEEEDFDDEDEAVERAPIVTVMGHVDHGKTSLLDFIRKAKQVDSEAGGITQHIGAYNVTTDSGKEVVFLDTPGHEAFTAMRARGAKVTDVAVIVIAADDQVMPQTKEAISHAQAAGVPMVFAINKIDKDGSLPEKIKEQLASMNLLVEDWGGKYQSQEISAKKGLNIDKLLEKILLESDLLELKANPERPAVGTVIEASLDKGRGYVTTVLISNGTLKVGDMLVAGNNYGKVKAMFNGEGARVKASGPSTAVQILGLNGAPTAGDKIKVYEEESEAKAVTTKRQQIIREQGLRTKKHITLAEIGRRLALGTFKELNIIIRGDVDGSVEALKDSLLKLSTEEIQVNVIFSGVGAITETDIMLASASDAIIIGFQVRPSLSARKLAERENIDLRLYSIIYDAIEEVKTAMEGMLEPKIEETITGMAEVGEVFKITKVGTVAGSTVIEGKVYRTSKIRVIRDGIVVHSGSLSSLKRFKDDAKEVYSGQECGISIKNYSDIHKGDFIEAYTETEVKRKL
jgi:translation initiation factor IF-2